MAEITITIRWAATEEGKATFSKAFRESSPILQADMLKDAIWELQQEYNRRLEKGLIERK